MNILAIILSYCEEHATFVACIVQYGGCESQYVCYVYSEDFISFCVSRSFSWREMWARVTTATRARVAVATPATCCYDNVAARDDRGLPAFAVIRDCRRCLASHVYLSRDLQYVF
ncbi:hypothetical protein NP493_178g01019 [Ridgeia piscesae]|uniref:Uncharacterized protein n=1 Tax=Ridgeia piscesae TaxID=27915 RepID=A0AAD9P2Q7_RIDPI|nr:hypothetical protein NP493_178g01019 [Ridgeia piscesae]